MFVVTADQHRSRSTGDQVPELLNALRPWAERWEAEMELPTERTVGDEIQTVLTTAEAALDLSLELMRRGNWAVGIGAGEAELPLAASARQSSGPVFIDAREAVERARGRAEPVPLQIRGADEDAAAEAAAVVQLLASVVRRRSVEGWEVIDRQQHGMSQTAIARDLGISPQAVSKRARIALIEEERRTRPVAARLLNAAASTAS